jgi:hypothetical protein
MAPVARSLAAAKLLRHGAFRRGAFRRGARAARALGLEVRIG